MTLLIVLVWLAIAFSIYRLVLAVGGIVGRLFPGKPKASVCLTSSDGRLPSGLSAAVPYSVVEVDRMTDDARRIAELERRLAFARTELRRIFPRGADISIVRRGDVQHLLDELEAESEWRTAS